MKNKLALQREAGMKRHFGCRQKGWTDLSAWMEEPRQSKFLISFHVFSYLSLISLLQITNGGLLGLRGSHTLRGRVPGDQEDSHSGFE